MTTSIIWSDNTSYSIGYFKENTPNEDTSIAAYDLDHTIIVPKSGKLFLNKKVNEWEFLPGIIDKIKTSLVTSKFFIVTNQKNLNKKSNELSIWKSKVCDILNVIDEPCTILVSYKNDKYRKPSPFMIKDNFKFKTHGSFYCGDAGGIYKSRSFAVDKKIIFHEKDFSDTDYKFALNLGIKFIHRDEYLYDDTSNTSTLTYPKFDEQTEPNNKLNILNFKAEKSLDPELILLVGAPGCGKSTVAQKYAQLGYQIINQDTLKTAKKCINETTKHLANNKCIVIDNTNPSKKTRQTYIDLAKAYSYKIKCIYFNVVTDVCKHNNIYRSIVNPSREVVPNIAYNVFKKNLELPKLDEGIDIIETLYYACDKENVSEEYFYYYF